ncbi:MAG: DUF4097 family beta strand repeat-containing protein [Gemmatimonadaceae bacterium]|nr:DUF4097 family beta strand repeat-containing protein [Gemmatimonadaceae bacterium]
MRTAILTMALGTITMVAPLAAQRPEQSEQALDWSGTLAAGRTLAIRSINGEIRVLPADGDKASVVGTKRWRRGRPEKVRVELQKLANGDVLVCAFWDEKASCDENGYRGGSGRNRWSWNDEDGPGDVSVAFEVRLPAGVNVRSSTVNGSVNVSGVSGRVDAETVNGSVTARSTGGPVRANTVNGGIDATMGTRLSDDLEFETVNGSITLTVPDGLDAELRMATTNGSVSSDFPLTVSGRLNPKRINATLGKGGNRLELQTVNGDVRLRKN